MIAEDDDPESLAATRFVAVRSSCSAPQCCLLHQNQNGLSSGVWLQYQAGTLLLRCRGSSCCPLPLLDSDSESSQAASVRSEGRV